MWYSEEYAIRIYFWVWLFNRTAASFQAAPNTSNPRQGPKTLSQVQMWKKRNGVLNISVPDTNSKFSPVLRKNLRMVTKISFLPRFKVLTFLVWWFKLGLEVKIKQKNFFYFQTRLVQTCSNLLAERLSKKVLLPCDRIEIMQDFVRMRLDSDYWEIFLSHSFMPAFVRSLMNRKLVQGTKRIFEWFSLLLCSIFQTHVRLLLPRQGGWINGGVCKLFWAIVLLTLVILYAQKYYLCP